MEGEPAVDIYRDVDRSKKWFTKMVELNKTPGNNLKTTTDPKKNKEEDFVIIAVPTPVTKAKGPDLEPIISASEIFGKNLKKSAIVVLESTVYRGGI